MTPVFAHIGELSRQVSVTLANMRVPLEDCVMAELLPGRPEKETLMYY